MNSSNRACRAKKYNPEFFKLHLSPKGLIRRLMISQSAPDRSACQSCLSLPRPNLRLRTSLPKHQHHPFISSDPSCFIRSLPKQSLAIDDTKEFRNHGIPASTKFTTIPPVHGQSLEVELRFLKLQPFNDCHHPSHFNAYTIQV